MSTDIGIGTVFTWGDRPVLTVHEGHDITFRDGYVASVPRPRRWWHLPSWIRVCRALWRMPYDPTLLGAGPTLVLLTEGRE